MTGDTTTDDYDYDFKNYLQDMQKDSNYEDTNSETNSSNFSHSFSQSSLNSKNLPSIKPKVRRYLFEKGELKARRKLT